MIKKFNEFIKKIFQNSHADKKKIVMPVLFVLAAIVVVVSVVSMRKTVAINVDGNVENITTFNNKVKDVIKNNDIALGEKDMISPSLESKITDGTEILIKKAIPITIASKDKEINLMVSQGTVGEMLQEEQSELSKNGIDFDSTIDEVTPKIDSELKKDDVIKLVDVEKKQLVVEESIDYDVIVEKSSEHSINYKSVKTAGKNGKKEVTYEVIYKDGVEQAKTQQNSKVILEPQNEIVVKGTSESVASRGAEVSPVASNNKVLQCKATAYSGGVGTSSGRKPVRDENGISTIAVDPSFIPMGTKMYIEGYGYAVAADTGTSIKGNKIDLYFNSYKESCDWGLRPVKVTIIAGPGEW